MIEIKHFMGIMNKDDLPDNTGVGQHLDALNLRFYGGANGLSAQNIPGNSLVTNSLLPAGTNECIGAYYDNIHKRIYWLNWNSNAHNGIYYYNITTGIIVPLLVSFTNSQTDIFGFDLDYPATDIHIIYTTDVDGDILDFNTRNKRPKAVNIKQAEDNIYGANWLEKYLDVATEPPTIPIKCAYEDDNTVTVNNLRKKLFRFKYRFWYADNEKTTWSAISEIPVPFQYTDPQVDTDPTKNCRIGTVIQTGDASVVKIEIAAQESLGNVFGNFFSVIILNKSDLSIVDNDVYVWRFYNSEAYVFVDLDESILDFDRVPDRANCQELLNGNVRVYGGIQEGLDPVIPNVSMDTNTEYPLAIDCNNILSVTQYGLEGFQQGNNIRFIVLGNIRMGQTFVAAILVGVTTFTITYTAVVGDTPASVLIGLSASATGQGFTQVSISANELVISRTNQILLRHNIATTGQTIAGNFSVVHSNNTVIIHFGAAYLPLFYKRVQFFLYANLFNPNPFTTVSAVASLGDLVITVEDTILDEVISTTLYFVNPINNSIPVYNSSSKENWALFYFDEKGKTNGATTSPDFNVTTKYLGMDKNLGTLLFKTPYITSSIMHRPPLWAKYYHWGRTENLTKQSSLDFVSDRTYKDDQFAYISIESIAAYKILNTNSIISYDFIPGDRISFYVLYFANGQPAVAYTQAHPHDYEIYDQVIDPDINGVVRTGKFVKIILPDTSGVGGVFDFSNGISLEYCFYYIELYTPAKSAAEGLDVYYEFSERYEIGDAGLPTRFHQGMLQNQSTDLIIPATFKFNKGDWWYRIRNITVGAVVKFDLIRDPDNPLGIGTVIGQKLVYQSLISTDYIFKDVDQYYQTGGLVGDSHWTLFTISSSYEFNVKGQIAINAINDLPSGGDFKVTLFVITGTTITTEDIIINQTSATTAQNFIYYINTFITVPPNSKVYLQFTCSNTNFRANIISGSLVWAQTNKQIEIGVIDQNFSDFYDSKVNSNGRSFTVHPDEKTNFFGTLIRFGRPYQQNTNINQINRFYPLDFDEIDRSKGDIQRFKTRDRILRVFQNRACGQFGVYARFIQNNSGDSQLVTTNDILTKNNINYYQGMHGLGDQYWSLVSSVNHDYFPDIITGDFMRLAGDGLISLSELYKGQFYFRSLLIPYNKPYLRGNGSRAKILGCYNPFDEIYIPVLQAGDYGGNSIGEYTFSFNERLKGFYSFYSFHPEWIANAEDTIYSWLGGNLYVHNNENEYCNFYGKQNECSITVVFNLNLFEKKTPVSITELASAIWSCPIIYSNVQSYAGQRQETELLESDFETLESMFHAALLRDIHSQEGIINGDFMKANYLVVKFTKDNASNLITLSQAELMWKDSPLSNK